MDVEIRTKTLEASVDSGHLEATVQSVQVQGTRDHTNLIHRDYPDQHPIEAITGLVDELSSKADQADLTSHEQDHVIHVTQEDRNRWDSGADKHYVHYQRAPSDTWEITHNLGKHPSVTVVDSAGSEVVGEVVLDTDNRIVIRFTGEFAGTAYLN